MWPNDFIGGLLDHGMFHPGNGRVHVLKTLPRWSKYEESMNSGWWFQTRFFFPFHIWDVILPIDELIFFKMVIATPTRIIINHLV